MLTGRLRQGWLEMVRNRSAWLSHLCLPPRFVEVYNTSGLNLETCHLRRTSVGFMAAIRADDESRLNACGTI